MITSNNNKMIVQVDPEASTNLVQKLALMQESGELCDYTIIVSGLEIKAHKCVLASCCDYFKTSFSFSESSQFSTEMDLTHLGCEVKVVENVIKSFYTNQIALDPNCLEGVLQLVDYFMCESLRLCIETFMESMLSFHTAVYYFQMALQYRLNLTGLFNSAKWLLWFHFHDYFIYQYDTLESSMDNINAYMTYDIFCHCNPLQLVEFMLKNVVNAVERLHTSGTYTKTDLPKVVHERVESTFQKLSVLLDKVRPDVLETWKPRLVNYLKTWKERNLPESEYFSELICHVRSLEIWLSDEEFNIDSLCSKKHKCHVCYRKFLISKSSKMKPEDISNFSQIVCTNQNCQSKNNPGMQDPNIGVIWTFRNEFEPDDDEYKARRDYCVCTPKPIRDYLISFDKTDSENRMLPSWLKPNEHEVQESLTIKNKPQTTSLTRQNHNMSSCVITTAEAIKEMDNLSSDIDQNSIINCHHPSEAVSSNQKEFTELTPSVLLNPRHMDTQELQCNILVVLAPSVEMATELMAVDDGQVRPLLKSPKLELSYYDIEANTWCKGCKLDFPIQGAMLEKHSWRIAYLDGCLYMFSLGRQVGLQYNIQESTWRYLDCQQLFTRHGDNSPVKSVIPIKVGGRLIVLSMSREAQSDGTYWTKQHYFEFQPVFRTFIQVASVEGDRMDVPITQWTVSEESLITVKASTMMYRNLSRIQYIHVYNAETRKLDSHEVECTMEAGVKVLVRDQVVYLIDRENWCRSYSLKLSNWTGMHRYPHIGLSSSGGSQSDDPIYPALTRVTCHAGSSRWEVTASRKCPNTCMQEILVDSDGELTTMSHPSPPFQFMTAMCPGTMLRSKLDLMEQPRFLHVDNQTLNFS